MLSDWFRRRTTPLTTDARSRAGGGSLLLRLVLPFVVTLTCLFAFAAVSMQTLSSVRAYVGGEGLWSKAQKEAVYHLYRYASTRDPSDFDRYQVAIAVPLGDHKARVELEKREPDYGLARQGFLEGRNDPDDIDGMIQLFRRFRHFDPIDRAIAIWAAADETIARLRRLADRLRAEVERDPPEQPRVEAVLQEIDRAADVLTPLEDAFSYTLGDASRRVTRILIGLLALATAVLTTFVVLFARSLLRERERAETEIRHLNASLEERVSARTAELESANRDLAVNNSELESFCYAVSHDLRLPLRAMNGFSELLLEDYGGVLDERARSYLERVRGACRRMGRLIDDLLSLTRYTRQKLVPASVDLSAIATSIVDELRAEQPERDVEVNVEPGLVATAGDPALLRVLLRCLLTNAWKYTADREGSRIDVGVQANGAGCAYYVRDNGCGFDMAYADQLFRVFNRLHAPEEFQGTGIGLAIVQRIVLRHGGRVWAESSPDEGATFWFTLEGEVLADLAGTAADDDAPASASGQQLPM